MIRCLAYVFDAQFDIRARLAAENVCLRQQLVVLNDVRSVGQILHCHELQESLALS